MAEQFQCRISLFWAHFRRFEENFKAPETGLSAPILYAPGGAYKYFRFNPLRGQKSASLPIFGLGVCLRQTPSYPPPADSPDPGANRCAALTGAFRTGAFPPVR
jgi:hypothetical protein